MSEIGDIGYIKELYTYNLKIRNYMSSLLLRTTETTELSSWNHPRYRVSPGTRENTNFWNEAWLGTSPLSLRFPNLFKLEKRKSSRISERRNSYGFAADWKRTPSAPVEIAKLEELKEIINSFSFSNAKDSWKFSLARDGVFRVNILRDQIDSVITDVSIKRMEWNSMVPIKVLVFIWRACLGRIPTADALAHRGVNTNSTLCSMCSSQEETADHLLVYCMFAHNTYKWISKWCGIDLHRFSTVEDVISFASQWGTLFSPKSSNRFSPAMSTEGSSHSSVIHTLPLTTPSITLVQFPSSLKLLSTNYMSWKTQIEALLYGLDLYKLLMALTMCLNLLSLPMALLLLTKITQPGSAKIACCSVL
ncbi:unnamed protein product [Lactuca virosa]|uniref:Reverse transcriptase zinc-binding domain-containing protein n=1 Tax=Lactuca virosa TaxID=75947 RepID=A0AAU9P4I5_9ASTR|nr:unnamed protein product [Lactuca virosa]